MSDQSSGFAGFRILLVEEDQAISNVVLPSLSRAGFSCEHASNPRSGIERFQQQDPHLVLLSLGLPQIGGAVLCGPIRVQSTVPIVVLSVRTRREDHFHALNIGADDFITMRPPDETMIMTRILTLLRRTYQYDGRASHGPNNLRAVPKPQSQLPPDWVTCESCGYMGPSNRFEKRDTQGQRVMSCPHCNLQQSLVFSVS
jgi:DNA-binding response OmpR family regulator